MNKFRCSSNGDGVHLVCGATSVGALLVGQGDCLMFSNPNGFTINVRWSETDSATATIGGYPILAGTKESVDVSKDVRSVAAITAGGSAASLWVHRGFEVDPD